MYVPDVMDPNEVIGFQTARSIVKAPVENIPAVTPLKRKAWNTPFKSPLCTSTTQKQDQFKTPKHMSSIPSTPSIGFTSAKTFADPITPGSVGFKTASSMASPLTNAFPPSAKKPFQSPLIRSNPLLREKKELEKSVEELINLKRKYELYHNFKEKVQTVLYIIKIVNCIFNKVYRTK